MIVGTAIQRLLLPVLFGVLASSCSISFHSNQFDALVDLFSQEGDPLEEARWVASWGDFDISLYAAYVEGGAVFVNRDGAYIHFNGWNITEAREVLPYGQFAQIEIQEDELLYFVDERLFDRHVCAEWRANQLDNGSITYLQDCEGRDQYSNQIKVDAAGEIVRLQFLLHPQYPALTMWPAIGAIE